MLDFLLAFLSGVLLGGAVAYLVCWIGHEPDRDKARAWDQEQRAKKQVFKTQAGVAYGRVAGYDETNEPNGNPV